MDTSQWPDAMADSMFRILFCFSSVDVYGVSRFAHQIVLEAKVVAEDDVAAVFSAVLGQGLTQRCRTSTWEIL